MKFISKFGILAGLLLCSMGIFFSSCNDNNEPENDSLNGDVSPVFIFKLNGDYVNNVCVMVDSTGTEILARSIGKIEDRHHFIALSDGYFAGRGALGWSHNRFTKWTIEEWNKLPKTPSDEEILANLIPDAKAIEIWEHEPLGEWFDFPSFDAPGLPDRDVWVAKCDSVIKAGFLGWKLVSE